MRDFIYGFILGFTVGLAARYWPDPSPFHGRGVAGLWGFGVGVATLCLGALAVGVYFDTRG